MLVLKAGKDGICKIGKTIGIVWMVGSQSMGFNNGVKDLILQHESISETQEDHLHNGIPSLLKISNVLSPRKPCRQGIVNMSQQGKVVSTIPWADTYGCLRVLDSIIKISDIPMCFVAQDKAINPDHKYRHMFWVQGSAQIHGRCYVYYSEIKILRNAVNLEVTH
ncbi:hypothetical protein BDR06DRAFT_1038029 [Suillus hirtellus]|nr:hypothetical protein BDR06DRAFT_1038029 [Suillus hirtellus]